MARNTKHKHKIAIVNWLDAESVDEWTESHLIDHGTANIMSVGWILESNETSVTLALNHDQKNESYSCIMKIPHGMIKSIKYIRS